MLALALAVLLAASACSAQTEIDASGPGTATEVPEANATPEVPVDPTVAPVEPTDPEESDPSGSVVMVNQDDLDRLERAEARWADAGISDYSYTVSVSCECSPEWAGPREVLVLDGVVVEVLYKAEPTDAVGYTAENLFALARDAIERGAEVLASYDENGFPVSATLDLEAVVVDGGFDYQISDFAEVAANGGSEEVAEPTISDRLLEAEDRWRDSGITSYEMSYERLCYCFDLTMTVTVENGQIVNTSTVADAEVTGEPAPEPMTVEDLFQVLNDAIVNDAYEITAEFDTDTGRPTRVWIDEDELLADEEYGFSVVAFDSTTQPVEVPAELQTMCASLNSLFLQDTEPETAEATEAMFEEMMVYAADLNASAPPEFAAGAEEFYGWLVLLRDASEQDGWDPTPYLDGDVSVLVDVGDEVLDRIEVFLENASEACGLNF